MSSARRLAAAAFACAWLAGCGGDDDPDRPTPGGATAAPTVTATAPGTAATTTTPTGPPRAGSPEERAAVTVRECLARQGYRATGGVRPPGTPAAPAYEILVAGPRGSAFIAFAGSLASARRYEAKVRKNARRVAGTSVVREGTITTVYVDLTDPTARERIQDCVRQES